MPEWLQHNIENMKGDMYSMVNDLNYSGCIMTFTPIVIPNLINVLS